MSDKVIPFRRPGAPVGGTVGCDVLHPDLVWDPATGLYSLVYRGVEVISRLDPVGAYEKLTGRSPR